MKNTLMLVMLFVLAMNSGVIAQTTVELFDATAIKTSDSRFPVGGPYNFNDAISFGETQVTITCPADLTGQTATVSGPLTNGGFIADNFLTVTVGSSTTATNICPDNDNDPNTPNQGNCFAGVTSDPSEHIGEAVETSFTAVGPANISSLLLAGTNTYTFNLMDYGGQLGNTQINLTTSCQVVGVGFPVCHRNNGKGKNGQFKTIFVDSTDAVEAHVRNHTGDHAGVCTGSETSSGS
jgi:hypothetical protein